jgi:hypothetical protein
VACLLALAALGAAACAAPAEEAGPDSGRAGLLIVHGDGSVVSKCINFTDRETTGAALLEDAGVEMITDATNPMGVLVCAIDQEGCLYPQEKCLCQCEGAGPCTYWAYFTLGQDGQWSYSPQGAAGRRVPDGAVDAWVWMSSSGAQDVGALRLPQARFEEICGE